MPGIDITSNLDVAVSLSVVDGALPLKTGQTTKYHDGDDGDLEKGLDRAYTVLSTGQYSGTSNITVNGKTVALSNNCVRDHKTKLMWARYVAQSDIGPGNDGKLYWEDAVNSEDIFEFCDQANAAELGGHGDWYVPNKAQFDGIVDLEAYNPSIDVSAFPSTPSDYFWMSSARPGTPIQAFNVYLRYAAGGFGTKAANIYYVRLVRDDT